MRITWGDGTNVDVGFYEKGGAKSQAAVEHAKLPDSVAVETQREHWRSALGRLKEQLEAG